MISASHTVVSISFFGSWVKWRSELTMVEELLHENRGENGITLAILGF